MFMASTYRYRHRYLILLDMKKLSQISTGMKGNFFLRLPMKYVLQIS